MFCDVYDRTTSTIIEAKGKRGAAVVPHGDRLAADSARMLAPAPKRAILATEQTRPDLLRLADAEGITGWSG